MNVYPFIEAEKACRRSVKRACELLKVSRAAFYQHLRGPSAREQQDAEIAGQIKAVHQESKGRYGAPRVHAQLARRGHRHGRKRVARIMRASGLHGRAAKRWKKTTIADPAAAARADRIRRDFTANAAAVNSPLVRRHHLHIDVGGVAVPGHGHRHCLAARRRLRDGRSPANQPGRGRAGQRGGRPRPRTRSDLS